MNSVPARLRRRAGLALIAAIAATAVSISTAQASPAFGPSYCNASSCDLASGPNSAYIYFEMPRSTPLSMLCWTDTQWYDGTNRWFKVSSIYGTGYTSANEVGHQTSVGHC